ncbi:iron uptake transporter deferrochelatase/peroxidase subunit [Klenkia brasiliensis]|uniref:Deferrochelatase n=1 Tax=Klenkia brasiliensis TaxID=333142 RepID=A0A1G7XSU4_9ACTN|nr:iron uptake transporter deferrochelatase/peroxidase subunit [Klenkia brasiliensis]SDG87201.1 deferrochelatase/peroxidase EfeB [Klenkia brasiliensis]
MKLSRRDFFGAAGVGAAGVVALGAGGIASSRAAAPADQGTTTASGAVEFHGAHQAGITTPAQDRLHFVAFDVITDDRAALVRMLQQWTQAARRMTRGQDAGPVGAVAGGDYAPPDDTGEAMGLPPAGLTLTIGFGPTLFTAADGTDRFGIADRRPDALVPLPAFPGDELVPAISDGDLCIQACADDPQVAVHAVRNLARIGQGLVGVRWSQLGFGRTSSTTSDQATPRNLFGFKDGTDNLKAEQTATLDRFVWVDDPGSWMHGGSYLVSRRIRMLVEVWDRQGLRDQEQTIGRTKGTGAPLGQQAEFDPVDLSALPATSHVSLAHPTNAGTAILRRGYSFVDGSDGLGRLDAGLFFLCYQADPATGFVQVQRNLRTDKLNEYVQHTSSALFACPPGLAGEDDWWGSGLFG